jgi:hypothetical protein
MTEIIIRDGIVSSLTNEPTIVWDAVRNGDNFYGTFNGNSFLTWNDFSKSTIYNLVSYFDENHSMNIPTYYEWNTDFYDTMPIKWSLYQLNYNGFFKYNGNNINFSTNGYGLGAVIQLVIPSNVYVSGFNIFSLIATIGNSNESPSWIPISLDYDLTSSSPLIHRFHFRSGREYATITINNSNFDITKPHVYSISGTPNNDNPFVDLYIDNKLVSSLIHVSPDIGSGWRTYNTSTIDCFIIGGNVGLQLPQPNTIQGMGIYSIFFYQNSYNYSEIFDLCKYRYNVPDVVFTPSVSYTTLNPPYVAVIGSTQFNDGQYISIL